MALTNQSTQAGIKASNMLSLNDLVRALRKEVKQAGEVSPNSLSEYEERARRLKAGWDMGKAGKNERYLMRAAGVFGMRNKIREKLNEADQMHKRGPGLLADREAKRGEILAEALTISHKLDDFRALPWEEGDKNLKQEASHKKSAATDAQLAAFYGAVGASQFRDAFLVAEFTGCRGEELGRGVRMEVAAQNGVPVLRFFIESAKCDGKKKGLGLREVSVPFPAQAAREVKDRWRGLAKRVASAGKSGMTVTLEATDKQTAGQRFTQNFRHFATRAGLKGVSSYSLRHRVSAQAKQGGDSINAAIVLGHQTTETQRHYGRSRRGGGGVSPVRVIGTNHTTTAIRGAPKRTGAGLHTKEKIALGKVSRAASPTAQKPRGPRL